MTITLSDKQKSAIDKLKDWFLNRTERQQVFSVLGYAGAGKSTIVNTPSLSLASTHTRPAVPPAFSPPRSPARRRW